MADFRDLADQLGLEGPLLQLHALDQPETAQADDAMGAAEADLMRGFSELQLKPSPSLPIAPSTLPSTRCHRFGDETVEPPCSAAIDQAKCPACDLDIDSIALQIWHDLQLTEGSEQGGDDHQPSPAGTTEFWTPAAQVLSGGSPATVCHVEFQNAVAVDLATGSSAAQRSAVPQLSKRVTTSESSAHAHPPPPMVNAPLLCRTHSSPPPPAVWNALSPLPTSPTVVLLCGGKGRPTDIRSFLQSTKQPDVQCILIDPDVGGYAQDIRVPSVLRALIALVTCPHVYLVFACPPCKWFCPLRGEGKGPGVIFSNDFPNGVEDADGYVVQDAQAALALWQQVFTVLTEAKSAGTEIILEQPVGRGTGSPFAIPGKEWHTTIFHTDMGAAFAKWAPLSEVHFDQCSPPINAPTQKTTAMHCTSRAYPVVLAAFGSLKCKHPDGHEKSLRTTDSDGVHFNTADPEVYTEGMCRLIAYVAHLLLRLTQKGQAAPSSSSPAPPRVATHQAEIVIDRGDVSTSLWSAADIPWQRQPVRILLDSCSDAHIIPSASAFITSSAPDLKSIGVGRAGVKVEFTAMGVVAIGLRVTNEETGAMQNIALLLDKAYLPAEGQANTCIISTGRLYEMQGIEIFLNDDNRLVMGRYSHQFSNINFSPTAAAMLASGPPRSLNAMTVRVHLTGVPKHTSLRAGHLRLGHASFASTALAFGLPLTRTVKCSCCLEFKARGPPAASTPAHKRASKVGERVSMDAWSYAKFPAATTHWTSILGAVDEAFDMFDVVGCAEPNGKIASQFLRGLARLYQSEYKAPISTSSTAPSTKTRRPSSRSRSSGRRRTYTSS